MSPHQNIIRNRFGGLAKLKHALDAATGQSWAKSTVQRWDDSGFIPSRHHEDVLKAGEDLEPPLTPDDFFEPNEDAA